MPFKKHATCKPRPQSWITLTDDQLRQILSLTEKDPLLRDVHDVVLIITSTGLRAGEMRDLRWVDVDLSRRYITIVRPNTFYPRMVTFGEEILRVLEARRRCQPELEYVLGASPRAVLERVSKGLAALSKTVGIQRVSIHSLRQACIGRLVNSGESISSIKLKLGLSETGYSAFRWSLQFEPLVQRPSGVASESEQTAFQIRYVKQ